MSQSERLGALGARGAAFLQRLGILLRRGLMPFRSDAPLSPSERRGVIATWVCAGVAFACVWSGAWALVAEGLTIRALITTVLATLTGAIFFGAAGWLMATLGNRLIARDGGRPPAER